MTLLFLADFLLLLISIFSLRNLKQRVPVIKNGLYYLAQGLLSLASVTLILDILIFITYFVPPLSPYTAPIVFFFSSLVMITKLNMLLLPFAGVVYWFSKKEILTLNEKRFAYLVGILSVFVYIAMHFFLEYFVMPE